MSEQKCPVCDGTGLVSKPPWVAGDQHQWSCTSAGPWPCKRCNGIGTFEVRAAAVEDHVGNPVKKRDLHTQCDDAAVKEDKT